MPSSIHSFGARSTTSINTTRSRTLPGGSRRLKIHWWERRPILPNAYFIDLQKGSYLASIYTLIQSIFQIIIAIFDIYCLIEAEPGTRHSRNFGINFMFVYSGNQHVRRSLMFVSALLVFSAIYLLVSSVILMMALRKEHELKFRHWLRALAIFVFLRFIIIIYQSIVNDLFFTYHQIMLIIWFLLNCINVFTWLVVYSNYQELSDITRLEDMAKLKMSTMSSLNASRSFSHHSLDSANPYGRYGIGSAGSSLQPSPQIYHHSLSTNQPLTLHESHQNIVTGASGHNSGKNSGGNIGTPTQRYSSQNSLHASYLQMYSNTLSQRSRQSSAASLSVNSTNANVFPMTAYNNQNTPSSAMSQISQPISQQYSHSQHPQSQNRFNERTSNYGHLGNSNGVYTRNSNTPM